MAFEHDMGAVRRCVMQVGLVLVCDSPAFPISNRDACVRDSFREAGFGVMLRRSQGLPTYADRPIVS